MAIYCFRCKKCGCRIELFSGDIVHYVESWTHEECGGTIIRDYKAEGVSVTAAVNAINRDFKSEAQRNDFLPTRKDFERTSSSEREVDQKIKDWNERHDNTTPGSGKYRPK